MTLNFVAGMNLYILGGYRMHLILNINFGTDSMLNKKKRETNES